MEKINFKHSVIFFNFCILISPFYLMLNFELIIFCLFLILILGISHGALDNIKGKKLMKLLGYKSTISFYLAYILISLLIILSWMIFPNTVLFLFLIVASFHFGKEDTVFSFKRRFLISECLFFLKGSSVILTPLLLQRDATIEIFRVSNKGVRNRSEYFGHPGSSRSYDSSLSRVFFFVILGSLWVPVMYSKGPESA